MTWTSTNTTTTDNKREQEILTPDNAQASQTFAGFELLAPQAMTKLGMCMILYGAAGVGKTPLAASCADSPHGCPTVFLDAEGGTQSIAHYDPDKLKVVQIYKWEELIRWSQSTFKDPRAYPFQTTVFDNLSEYYMLAQKYITQDREMPSQPEYGKINQLIISFVEDWRDFTRRTGRNVIFIAWDDRDKDENSVVKSTLAFTPGVVKALPGKVDIIGHLSVHNNPPYYTRILNFAPSPKNQAKFRRSLLGNAQKIPYEIPFHLENMPMPDILSVLKGGGEWPSQKYTLPQRK